MKIRWYIYPNLICLGIVLALAVVSSPSSAKSTPGKSLQDWQTRLREQIQDETVSKDQLLPLAVVAISQEGRPAPADLVNLVIQAANQLFPGQILVCDTCLNEQIDPGSSINYRRGPVSLGDIRLIYQQSAPSPQAALWLDFNQEGLSYRIVAIESGRVIFSDNLQDGLDWTGRSGHHFSASRLAERQGRNDAIYHHNWDLGLYPGFHLGYSFLNQWGPRNDLLSGFSFSFLKPNLAIGVAVYQVLAMDGHPIMGAKILVKTLEAVGASLDESSDSSGSLVAQFVYKHPFPGNLGGLMALALFDTEGNLALGVSW